MPLRPSESGGLCSVTSAYRLFQGEVPPCFEVGDSGIQIIETQPDALLRLSSRQIRYWFRTVQWNVAVVMQFGLDVHNKEDLKCRCDDISRIGVYWKNEPSYAQRVIAWWSVN